MKNLPYYRWYPADAEGDDFYSSLSLEQVGLYHRCLNRAWMNDGIPADIEKLARIVGVPLRRLEALWAIVGSRWVESPRDSLRLINPRQEIEYTNAIQKSENNKRVGNANAKGTRTERALRASDSVSVSGFVCESSSPKRKDKTSVVVGTGSGFEFWWDRYPLKVGQDQACRVWLSHDCDRDYLAVRECLDSYLASGEVARGIIMRGEKWLAENARDHWRSRWLPPNDGEVDVVAQFQKELKEKQRDRRDNGQLRGGTFQSAGQISEGGRIPGISGGNGLGRDTAARPRSSGQHPELAKDVTKAG